MQKILLNQSAPFDKKTTIWIIMIHAFCLLAPFTFTWRGFYTFIVLYCVIGMLGIVIGFHRLLTHRSFKTPKWVEYAFAIIACLSAQRSPIFWVATHRQHHVFSDGEGDPHSPKDGFWWAHVIWAMKNLRPEDENAYYKQYAPDLANDAGHRWIQKYHETFPLLLAISLFVIGGLPLFVWGFCMTLAAVYHGTWMVNSVDHTWGYKNYKIKDDSRNNALVNIFTFGDGWHNNHHAHPTLARNGHKFWEWDPAYGFIRLMSWVGLASGVRSQIPARAVHQVDPQNIPVLPVEEPAEPALT